MQHQHNLMSVHCATMMLIVSLLALASLAASSDKQETSGDLEDDCPDRCVCLAQQAYCDNIALRKMPFHLPSEVITLSMHNNLVRRLYRKQFKPLSQLKHLILKNNRISYIEPQAFKDMHLMRALSLTDNSIRDLPPDIFKFMPNLQVLSLRNNRIGSVEKIFNHGISLKLLNLGSNRIRQVTEKTFKNNFQLSILDLNNNRIRAIHRHAFKALPLLKFLVLRDNPLKSLQLDFGVNNHMELLDLTNCGLKEMIKGLPYSINDLRLAENQLTKITQEDFKSSKKIRLLVLNNNQIEEVQDDAFGHLADLYDLYLGGNKLHSLPKGLPRSLHGIYANYNNISKLARYQMTNCAKLQEMTLSHNHLKSVDSRALRGLENLHSLDLSYNDLDIVEPMTFADNNQLRKLDLSHNPLLELGKYCFHGLGHLHILQMASVATDASLQPVVFEDTKSLLYLDVNNSPTMASHLTLHPHFITSVEDLNLMNDMLRTLPSYFSSSMAHLHTVKLGGNPWHCDINIYPLTLWMRNISVSFHEPHLMKCVSPPRLKGRLITSLTMDDLNPRTTTSRPFVKIELGSEKIPGLGDEDDNSTTSLDIREPETHKITTQVQSDSKESLSTQPNKAAKQAVVTENEGKGKHRRKLRKFAGKKKGKVDRNKQHDLHTAGVENKVE